MNIVIRVNLLCFPASGPAFNPAIATGYPIYFVVYGDKSGWRLPHTQEWAHYACYWLCSFVGALAAIAVHVVVLGPVVDAVFKPRPAARAKAE
eukprot:g47093.t1